MRLPAVTGARAAITLFLVAGLARAAGAAEPAAGAVRTIAAIHVIPPVEGEAYRPVYSEERLRDELRVFLGRSCDPAAIQESLARPYRFLGYVPSIEASCDDGTLSISVRESSHRIELITFDVSDLSRIGVRPDREFEETRKLYPVPTNAPRALLRGLLETREGDLYNSERYRSEREVVARLGYTIAFIPGAPADPLAYPPGAYLIVSLTPPPRERPYVRRETNYLGGTGSYAPRSGAAVGAIYQKDEVFGRLDRLTVTPTYNSSLGGTISYKSPVLAAREGPRSLYDLNLDLYSNFTHNRRLEGITTDERRSGLGAAVGIRPLGLTAPHDLRLEVGLRHEQVNLGGNVPGQDDESLTVLRLGATHEWRHTYRWPSVSTRIAPALDFAFAWAGGQQSFTRAQIDATVHGRSPMGLETDLHFAGGTMDRHVPSFELFSLGGPTTVRGFREDTFLGRNVAALQAELWLPFFRPEPPPLSGSDTAAGQEAGGTPPRFEPRAARLIRAALFVDGGSISATELGRSETLLGAGVGLRFVVPHQPLVFRIDYGWGFGGRGGESFPYLSLAYRF